MCNLINQDLQFKLLPKGFSGAGKIEIGMRTKFEDFTDSRTLFQTPGTFQILRKFSGDRDRSEFEHKGNWFSTFCSLRFVFLFLSSFQFSLSSFYAWINCRWDYFVFSSACVSYNYGFCRFCSLHCTIPRKLCCLHYQQIFCPTPA